MLLLAGGLFAAEAVTALFSIFAPSVLGVMLLLTGAQVARGPFDFPPVKEKRLLTLVVAAASIWNVGIGFVLDILIHYGAGRGQFRR